MAVPSAPERRVQADPDARVRTLFAPSARHHPAGPAGIAGLEQEYSVWQAGRQVDFGGLIDVVAPAAAIRRFAFDDNARIVPSGAVWTVDHPHAEIATAPRALARGIASRLAGDALAERSDLRRQLSAGSELRGYSTHLNAYAAGVDGWTLARHVAATYAPAIMLVAERSTSPGLLVRPRYQRLEVGTEFLETEADLVAATLLVLACVVAAWHEIRAVGLAGPSRGGDRSPRSARSSAGDAATPRLGPLDARAFRQTWQRPGLFVPRDAFGEDLYLRGRAARLRRLDGTSELAGDRLDATWARLRAVAAAFARPDELALVDALVGGARSTPLERRATGDPVVPAASGQARRRPGSATSLLMSRQRGELRLTPEYITWELAVLRVASPWRAFFLRVPRSGARRLERLWASGALDAPLAAYAARPVTGAVATLDEPAAGLFDTIEAPAVAAERMEPDKAQTPSDGKRKRRALPPPPAPVPQHVLPGAPGRPPTGPPATVKPPAVVRPGPRLPWLLIGLVVVITVGVLWRGLPGGSVPSGSRAPEASATALVTALPDCPPGQAVPGCPGANSNPPSATLCPIGVPCGSTLPGAPSRSPGAAGRSPGTASPSIQVTPCPVGAVCATGAPTPRPTRTPAPTPRPTRTPAPTPRPTRTPAPAPSATATPAPSPTPDRTGPSITGLAWSPGTIGVPAFGGTCDPATGLGQAVDLSVLVTDPSGVESVVLAYQRALDAAPVSVPMTLSGGRYRLTLTTTSGTAAWQPAPGSPSYVVSLSVMATDMIGNVRTTPAVAGFTVTTC
jgi:hypothetical protein